LRILRFSTALALTGGKTMIISKGYQGEAFSKEAQANRYLVFARQAEKEGYPQIAQLFRATAQREAGLRYPHLWAPGGFETTAKILGEAVSGETRDLQETFPVMSVAAENEGRKKPPESPISANDREKHTTPFQKALKRLAEQEKGDYYVCCPCGYTCERQRPGKCPLCQSEEITLVKVG
jgi:rubrerythrin